jgi:hypothetical protein
MTKLYALALGVFLLPLSAFAAPALSLEDTSQINDVIFELVGAVVYGWEPEREEILSPNMSDKLRSDLFFAMPFDVSSFGTDNQRVVEDATLPANQVRFVALAGGSLEGRALQEYETSFVFEKVKGEWYLLDTDIHTKFSGFATTQPSPSAIVEHAEPAESGAWVALGIMGTLLVLGLLSGIFWIWMLVAACTRTDMAHKALWILLIVLTGLLGAIIYYFVEHLPYKKAARAAAPVATPPPAA